MMDNCDRAFAVTFEPRFPLPLNPHGAYSGIHPLQKTSYTLPITMVRLKEHYQGDFF